MVRFTDRVVKPTPPSAVWNLVGICRCGWFCSGIALLWLSPEWSAKTSPHKPKSPFPIDKDDWCFLENHYTFTTKVGGETFLQLDALSPKITLLLLWGNAADCINARVNIMKQNNTDAESSKIDSKAIGKKLVNRNQESRNLSLGRNGELIPRSIRDITRSGRRPL